MSGERICDFEAHENYALGVSFTGDGKTLISAGMDGKLKLWSVPDFQLIRSLQAHTHSLNSFALDQRQTLLASASTDTTVKIWSFPDLHLRHTLHDRKKTAAAVALSPEGEWTARRVLWGALLVLVSSGEYGCPDTGERQEPCNGGFLGGWAHPQRGRAGGPDSRSGRRQLLSG